MLTNYLKITFRSLWKTRGHNFLNIFGLTVGIAAAALIFLWVEDEMGYDDFPGKENIYIVKSKQTLDGVTKVFDAVPGLLGPAIKDEIPDINYAARVSWKTTSLFAVDDSRIYQDGYFAEPDFMDIFSLQFVEGDSKTAMDAPNDLVITQSAAARLFGNESALGKTVRLDDKESFLISGVVKDLPKNSTYQFDWLIPFETYENANQQMVRQWNNFSLMTFVQLNPSADLAVVDGQLRNFVNLKLGDHQRTANQFLYPMTRWRLYNSADSNGNEQEGRIKYVRLFSVIAWVVLVIACINFMNLATARSEKRAKEVGMRKVVGATRTSLIGQFLSESLVLAAISAVFAVVLVYLVIGGFNSLIEKELSITPLKVTHLIFLGNVVLVCGLLSGIYPAFYLSSFNPISTLKSTKQKVFSGRFIRQGLVVLQPFQCANHTLVQHERFQQCTETRNISDSRCRSGQLHKMGPNPWYR